jgi:hypothetical protein
MEPRALPPTPIPLSVKLWLAFMAAALVGGLVNLFRAHEPEAIVPILGYVDRPPAQPSPAARPAASPAPR